MSERPTQNELDEANSSYAQDAEEQEVLALAVSVCAELNPSSISPLNSQGDYYTMTPEELLAFASKLRSKDAATIAALWRSIDHANEQIDEQESQLAALREAMQRIADMQIVEQFEIFEPGQKAADLLV